MASRSGSIGSLPSTAQSSVISFASIDYNGPPATTTPPPPPPPPEVLEPCSATARLFLYAQGSSVVCLQYETLQVERRFERHQDDVSIIAAEASSDEAAPHRVVSVDRSKLAIVWDANSGEEISRFTAFEEIRVAAWMKNGNLAFGDSMGNVILFDPSRAESISARTILNPLTSIAPAADCKSFALGYANGSILVAALSPAFTILHTLTTTSLSPSPIVTLAWHASSSRQKSDMLATQTREGDVRVWSVPKSVDIDDTARVVRVLRRDASNRKGNNWLAWSRNGRIVHYSDGTTTIWDVRTKKVAWEEVPTLDNVAGISVYGPKGALFTLGRDNTVQQFALYPPTLLANVHQAPAIPPPSPPVSIEEKKEEAAAAYEAAYAAAFQTAAPAYQQSAEPAYQQAAEPAYAAAMDDEERAVAAMSPLGRIAHELEQLEKMEHPDGGLGISNMPRERAASVSSRSSQGSRTSASHARKHSYSGSPAPRPPQTARSSSDASDYSTASAGHKGSVGTLSALASPRKQHPLRQEIHLSPDQTVAAQQLASPVAEVAEVADLFPNLRTRIATVVYESPRIGSPNIHLSDDDLRREMLYCIFGWKGDIEALISDELDSANARSLNAVVLRMWLGDLDQNSLAVLLGADFNVGGDWLFLALSAMGGQQSWNHVVRAYVMRLLQKGDVHLAVLCLLALGDKNDAVEVYVSHKHYLEAVLLTALLWKKEWKRQSQLVRKWGAHAQETHETGLAARCFACAGTEAPPERPALPKRSASHSRSRSETESLSNFVRGLSISAPSNPRTTLKMTPKNSPLKLITSFEERKDPIPRSATTSPPAVGVNRFFSGGGPRSATATPIAMSALTPIDPFWQNDMFPSSARTITPGPQKLAPVTESSPADATPKADHIDRLPLPPPMPEERDMNISSPIKARNSSGFAESKPVTLGDHSRNNSPAPPVSRIPSPPQSQPLPGPPSSVFHQHVRKMSAARKPAGLNIQWPPIDSVIHEGTQPVSGSPPRGHQRKGSRTTPPPVGLVLPAKKSPGSIDNFLELLENSQKRLDSQRAMPRATPRLRGESPEPRGRRPPAIDVAATTDVMIAEMRGRHEARARPALHRSPSSPLPMSDQAKLYREDERDNHASEEPEPAPEPLEDRYFGDGRGRARSASRGRSPPRSKEAQNYREESDDEDYEDERYYTTSRGRGRSKTLEEKPPGGLMRSPSSPLPMSPQAKLYQQMSAEADNDDDDERHRQRRPGRLARTDSRTRGPQLPRHLLAAVAPGGIRRSRSERTLRQWSDQLEQAAAAEMRHHSPAPSLSRNRSMSRGLPSNPRAWRAELQAESRNGSRANSPAPPARDRSPAMAPAPPPPPQRSGTPGRRAMSPLARGNDGRNASPGRRAMSPMSRTMSPAIRERSLSRPGARKMSEADAIPALPTPPLSGVRRGTEPIIPTPRSANYYYPAATPNLDSYESLPNSPQINIPAVPALPALTPPTSGSGSGTGFFSHHGHQRSQSDQASQEFAPLIRKLPPQPPPDSPPPLPVDLPVHPRLQMNLDPAQPGRRTVRRVQRSDELREDEQSILVGIDAEETRAWESGPPIEIAVPPRRPSVAGGYRMAPSPPMMGLDQAIGSMNQI